MYMLDAGALDDNLLDNSHGIFSCMSSLEFHDEPLGSPDEECQASSHSFL
jgi:hypothetical protein